MSETNELPEGADLLDKIHHYCSNHVAQFFWFLAGNITGWAIFTALDQGMYIGVLTIGAFVAFVYLFVRHYSESKRATRKGFLTPWAFSFGWLCASCIMFLNKNAEIRKAQNDLQDVPQTLVAVTNAFKRELRVISEARSNLITANNALSNNLSMAESAHELVNSFELLNSWAWREFSSSNYESANMYFKLAFYADGKFPHANFRWEWVYSPYTQCAVLTNPTPENCDAFTSFIDDLTAANCIRAKSRGLLESEADTLRTMRPMLPSKLWPIIDKNIEKLHNRAKDFLPTHP